MEELMQPQPVAVADDNTIPKARKRRRSSRGRKRPTKPEQQAIEAQGEELPIETEENIQNIEQTETTEHPENAAHTESSKDSENSESVETKPAKRQQRARQNRNRNKEKHTLKEPEETAQSLPLTADTPLLLLDSQKTILEPVSVISNDPNRNKKKVKKDHILPIVETEIKEEKAKKVTYEGRKLIASVLPDDQIEVVILEDGFVKEYYIEMTHQAKTRGNIYKGVISNIDTNLQAAFINYGPSKNGFLQIDEVHPEYYLSPVTGSRNQKFPPIQKVLKPGQEILVQVGKEPTGNKGAFLTTWISLAGRFVVLTPGQEQIGISRKVEDDEERDRLRELIKGLSPGEGFGAIVRTVSAGVTKTILQKDLNYLKRLWKDIRKRAMQETPPCLIYKEPGLAARAIRDYLTEDINEIWVDDAVTAQTMQEMVSLLFPRKGNLVKLHEDTKQTLLESFDILRQIEQIHSREVVLPSGGRLVFDQTEALMAIDINSGKTSGKNNFENLAYKTNMEAAEHIAHQLRLRDIGGQVVIDFIEMRDQNQVREVEKTLRNSMKADRARHDIGKMSSFGLLQLVRQRTGSSAIAVSMEPCPFCQGTGSRRNIEWQAVQALRDIHRKMRDSIESGQSGLVYMVEPELALYLLNQKRERLRILEQDMGVTLEIRPGRMAMLG